MIVNTKELLEALVELKELESKTPDAFKKLDSEFWMIPALMNLYQMCKTYNQTEYPSEFTEGYEPARRVIKVNRFIPKYYMAKLNLDIVQMGGMYLAIDGLFISEKLMSEYFASRIHGKGKQKYDPVQDLNLPSEYNYGTIRPLHNGMGFVLKEDGVVPTIISSPSHWEFLGLDV